MDIHRKTINEKLVAEMTAESLDLLRSFDKLCEDAPSENQKLLLSIINDNQNTEIGQKYHFDNINNFQEYAKSVPLTTYEDYCNYIDRMIEKNERNIITSYPIEFYAKTSGTSGSPKKIPVSDRSMKLFRDYSSTFQIAVIQEYYRNSKGISIRSGLRFMILDFTKNKLKNGIPFGSISTACLSDNSIPHLESIMTTPKEVLFCNAGIQLRYLHARFGLEEKDVVMFTGAYIPALLDEMKYIAENWELLVEDIALGTINPQFGISEEIVDSLKDRLIPNPERANELRREFEKGIDETLIKRIWPNLLSINAIWAGNFSSYARKLRRYTGDSVPYYSMSYVSSEGIFAIARYPYEEKYVLIPDSCFYEFIPIEAACDNSPEAQPDTLLMNELEIGKEYELVVTNQSGLYRYRMGDIVRVTGFYKNSPAIEFKYRKKNIVSIAGEKFTESDLSYVIKQFEHRTGILVIDFCMYPDMDSEPGRYIFFIETEEHISSKQHDYCQRILTEELINASSSLGVYIANGSMGTPKLIFLKRGTFLKFREQKMFHLGINSNQFKPLTVITEDQKEFFLKMSRNTEGII